MSIIYMKRYYNILFHVIQDMTTVDWINLRNTLEYTNNNFNDVAKR